MFRIATENDNKILYELWQQGFNEDEQTAKFVFESFVGYNNILLFCEQEQPIAMLCMVEVALNNKKGIYLYGLTTAIQHRKKGVMASLIAYAETYCKQKQYKFFVLIPQSQELFKYYETQGFTYKFKMRKFSREVKNNLWAQGEYDGITAKNLPELRNEFLPKQRISLNKNAEIATIIDMYTNGACTVQNENGYGIYYKNGDTMFFEEIAANSKRAADIIIEAARQRSGCTIAKGLAAADSEYFLGEGPIEDFACLKFLDEEFTINDAYINMMLN